MDTAEMSQGSDCCAVHRVVLHGSLQHIFLIAEMG